MQLTAEQAASARSAADLSRELVSGYYTLLAALAVASLKDVNSLMRSTRARPLATLAPVGELRRRNGARYEYSRQYYLARLQDRPEATEAIERSWLTAVILQLGELFAQNSYFDRTPELELFRHLRNAVAHGNIFKIAPSADLDLKPAHNGRMLAEQKGCSPLTITRALNGKPVLFEFVDRADVLDLVVWIGHYLERLATEAYAVLNAGPPRASGQFEG